MAAVNSLLVVLSATFSSCSDIFSLGTKKICIARNVNVHPTEKALINPGNLDLAKRLIAGQTFLRRETCLFGFDGRAVVFWSAGAGGAGSKGNLRFAGENLFNGARLAGNLRACHEKNNFVQRSPRSGGQGPIRLLASQDACFELFDLCDFFDGIIIHVALAVLDRKVAIVGFGVQRVLNVKMNLLVSTLQYDVAGLIVRDNAQFTISPRLMR